MPRQMFDSTGAPIKSAVVAAVLATMSEGAL